MSDDVIEEETKRILAEVDADAQSGTDDSKASKKNEKQTDEIPKSHYKDNEFDEVIEEW